jgi:hypothetical protein
MTKNNAVEGDELGRGMKIFMNEGNGKLCLTIMEPESDEVREFFEELGLQGGGYTWQGIVSALVDGKLPDLADELEVDAEADNMWVYALERGHLERVAALVRSVASSPAMIRRIVEDEENEIE